MLRTGRLPAPHRGRSSPASTSRSRPTPGVLLPGTLASPRTGLTPAGCRELVARLRRGALLSVLLGARATGRTFLRNHRCQAQGDLLGPGSGYSVGPGTRPPPRPPPPAPPAALLLIGSPLDDGPAGDRLVGRPDSSRSSRIGSHGAFGTPHPGTCRPAGKATWLRMITDIDVREALPQIRVPTSLMHRTGDRAVDVEASRY